MLINEPEKVGVVLLVVLMESDGSITKNRAAVTGVFHTTLKATTKGYSRY